jgi:hypothetical protein
MSTEQVDFTTFVRQKFTNFILFLEKIIPEAKDNKNFMLFKSYTVDNSLNAIPQPVFGVFLSMFIDTFYDKYDPKTSRCCYANFPKPVEKAVVTLDLVKATFPDEFTKDEFDRLGEDSFLTEESIDDPRMAIGVRRVSFLVSNVCEFIMCNAKKEVTKEDLIGKAIQITRSIDPEERARFFLYLDFFCGIKQYLPGVNPAVLAGLKQMPGIKSFF